VHGVPKERSKVLLIRLRFLDKRRLDGVLGNVAAAPLKKVDEALKVATGLTRL